MRGNTNNQIVKKLILTQIIVLTIATIIPSYSSARKITDSNHARKNSTSREINNNRKKSESPHKLTESDRQKIRARALILTSGS